MKVNLSLAHSFISFIFYCTGMSLYVHSSTISLTSHFLHSSDHALETVHIFHGGDLISSELVSAGADGVEWLCLRVTQRGPGKDPE